MRGQEGKNNLKKTVRGVIPVISIGPISNDSISTKLSFRDDSRPDQSRRGEPSNKRLYNNRARRPIGASTSTQRLWDMTRDEKDGGTEADRMKDCFKKKKKKNTRLK